MLREFIKSEDEISPLLRECVSFLNILRKDLLQAFDDAKQKGEIRDIDPIYTLVNILSLDIFFYLGKPIVELLHPNIDSEEFENKRVEHVIDLLMNGLKIHTE